MDQANDIRAIAPKTMVNIHGALFFTIGEAPLAFLVAEGTADFDVLFAAPRIPLCKFKKKVSQ
jgi:hypothetical protein